MSDVASSGSPGPPGVRVALDIQVLQTVGRPKAQWPGWPGWPPGSTPLRDIQSHVSDYAAALARAGLLAAALLAPEYPAPAPDALPPGLLAAGAVRWDSRQEVRRLVAGADPADPAGVGPTGPADSAYPAGPAGPAGATPIVHHVPAPFLDTDFGDPAGQVVSADWAEAGVPRVVTVHDLDPLEDPDRWLGSPARRARYQARAAWVAEADLIVAASERAAKQVVALLGYPVERVVTAGPGRPGSRLVRAVASSLDLLGVAPHPPPSTTSPPSTKSPPSTTSQPCPRRDHRDRRATELPLRLALVGPYPPHGGGIGDYNDHFLTALTTAAEPAPNRPQQVRVDAVLAAAEGWTHPGWQPPAGVGKLHPESLGRDVRPAGYDHLVYTVGNSSGHLATIETALRHPGWLWLHETRLPAVATTALEGLGDDEFRDRMAWLLERAYPGRAPLAAAGTAGRSHLALAEAGVGLAGLLVARSAGVLVNSEAARRFLLLDLPPLAWHPPVHVLPPGCPPVRPRRAAPDRERERERARDHGLAVAFGVVSMSKRPDLLVDAAARAGFRLAFVGPCPPILAELIGDRARHLGISDRVEVTGAVDDDSWWAWMDRADLAVQLREQSSGELSAAVLDAMAAGVPVVTNLPSAADYPAGTVALLPGGPGAPPDPGEVAAEVDRLLADPASRHALSEAGQRYAASHQMSDLARAVLRTLTAGG